jgi:cobalamin-dependent methionine synthase I
MFTVVGERINTSRKQVQKAVEEPNASYIQEDIKRQQDAGANYIDVNAGARIGHEMEDMEWLLEVIQKVVTVPLCLDSPDLKVIERRSRSYSSPRWSILSAWTRGAMSPCSRY